MKVKIRGNQLAHLLEAARWAKNARDANIQSRLDAILKEPGGKRRLVCYLMALGRFAANLEDVLVSVEMVEDDKGAV